MSILSTCSQANNDEREERLLPMSVIFQSVTLLPYIKACGVFRWTSALRLLMILIAPLLHLSTQVFRVPLVLLECIRYFQTFLAVAP